MRNVLLVALALCPGALAVAADPVAELSSFSVFNNVDLTQLAKSDAKTSRGAPMNTARFLSVQSVYVAPVSPAQHLSAMRNWNPVEHHEPRVFLFGDLPGSPSESSFARLKNAPDNAAVRAFVAATAKMAKELQLSRDEAARWKGGDASLAGAGGDFWMGILGGRARAFVSGGSSGLAPYDHTGSNIRPGDELNGLLREQPKIRKQFAGLLDGTGIGRGGGSSRPDLYWQLGEVDNAGAVSLGAFYGRTSGSGAQAADTFYYASGGYYVTLTLYQMWPVDVNGQASTLVWRGDMVSSASLADLHGVERLGSESAMMKDVAKSIARFRKEGLR